MEMLGPIRAGEGGGWVCGLCEEEHASYRDAVECRRAYQRRQSVEGSGNVPRVSKRGERPARSAGTRRRLVGGGVQVEGQKSNVVVFLLTFFLGPAGLFYSSSPAALMLLFAGLGGTVFLLVFLPVGGWIVVLLWSVAAWIAAMLIGPVTVRRYNRRLALEEQRHRELVEAAQGR